MARRDTWKTLALTCGLLAAAGITAAQAPPAAQTPPAQGGGTAPAQPAAAKKFCAGPEHRQFDFWVGEWEVKAPDGSFSGINKVESILGGCVVQESWKGVRGMTGMSFNTYSAADGKWHQTWVDDREGFSELAGGLQPDGKMVMVGDLWTAKGEKRLQRWTWEPRPDGLVQRSEVSQDGGKTWKEQFSGTYVRK